MKGLMSVLVIIGTLLMYSLFSVSASVWGEMSDAKGEKCEEAVQTLTSLEILQGYKDGLFKPNDTMTRAEFAVMVTRVLGLNSVTQDVYGVYEDMGFNDVADDQWAAGSIAMAVKLGLMKGVGNGMFAPDETISYQQVIKILVCVTGYEQLAEMREGYPMGYITVAAEKGILKDIKADYNKSAVRGDIAIMVLNAMETDLLVETIGQKDEYKVENGNTLLDQRLQQLNLVKKEGQVTATSVASLSGKSNLNEGEVEIDGVTYKTGNTDVNGLLGFMVDFYYEEDTGSASVGTLRSIFAQSGKNSVMTIESDNIESINLTGVEYTENENDEKTKTEKISETASFIYNNQALSSIGNGDLLPKSGIVKLLDSNNDGEYDVIFIEEDESFVVDHVSASKSVIYIDDFNKDITFRGAGAISLKKDDKDYEYFLEDADGTPIEVSALHPKDIISVMASKDQKYVRVVRTQKSVTGILEEKDDSGEITVNGAVYKVLKDSSGNLVIDLNIGDSGTFYLDKYNKVFADEKITDQNDCYAYVADESRQSGGVSPILELKLLHFGSMEKKVDKNDDTIITYDIKNSMLKVLQAADKIKLDGVSIDSDKINTSLKGRMIHYWLNNDGRVNKIEFPVTETGSPLKNYTFNSDIMSFGKTSGGFLIDNHTKVICVPNNLLDEDDYYAKVTLKDSTTYMVQPFDVDSDTQIAKTVILMASMSEQGNSYLDSTSADIYIISNIAKVLDENGDSAYKLHLINNGEEVDIYSNNNPSVISVMRQLKKGDLICYTEDVYDRINAIVKIASPGSYTVPFFDNLRQKNELLFAMAYDVKSNTFSSVDNEMVDEITVQYDNEFIIRDVPRDDGPPIFIYKKTTQKAALASAADIATYKNVGQDADKVLIVSAIDASSSAAVRAVVIVE